MSGFETEFYMQKISAGMPMSRKKASAELDIVHW